MNTSTLTFQEKLFETKNRDTLNLFFFELNKNWDSSVVSYNNKKTLNYIDFVKYCYSIKW